MPFQFSLVPWPDFKSIAVCQTYLALEEEGRLNKDDIFMSGPD